MRRLVIGGARSGKSALAETLVADAAAVDYVATSQVRDDDPEWVARVAAHVTRRPAHWRTIETVDLPAVLGRDDDAVVLVDCLTVWLTRMMDECGCWGAPGVSVDGMSGEACGAAELRGGIDALIAALAATRRDVVLVTNEVGLGVVPATVAGRLFRDEMGHCNARVAQAVDEVWWVVAGIPTRIKP